MTETRPITSASCPFPKPLESLAASGYEGFPPVLPSGGVLAELGSRRRMAQ